MAALLLPAGASAHPAYVDQETGSGSACEEIATPCATIAAALAVVEDGGLVLVDDSAAPYNESVSLGDGKSLRAQDFVGGSEAQWTIDGGVLTGIDVLASGAGVINGFTLRGNASAVMVGGAAGITGNRFDDPTQSADGDVQVLTAASVSISSNEFTDSDSVTADAAIHIASGAAPLVTDNQISGYDRAIEVTDPGTQPQISQNTITGGHGPSPETILIDDDAATPILSQNDLGGPGGDSIGIHVLEDTATGSATSAVLLRNTVSGYPTAVAVEDTTGPVTLTGDLLVANSGTGLALSDTAPTGTGEGDVTATNITFANNATDISSQDADLTLDSSIVEDAIGIAGALTCTITFSRGPTTTPGGNGCMDFQTTATPGFVNPAGGNFHLASGAAMIDVGNPAAPAAATDLDGDPRQVDGDCNASQIRDIGADEFVLSCLAPPAPEPADTTPPETQITAGPKARTKSKSATFSFNSTESGSSFECRLDEAAFQRCTSPDDVRVKKGRHTFEVRAKDAAGNVDPTPASQSWTVKKKKKKKKQVSVAARWLSM